MAATLYAVPASHPCACVERALQLKGIAYRRIDMPPVAHKAVQKAVFGGSTVPGLVLDGRKVLGSRPIIRALEERSADPPLLPADPKERKSVELAEGWGDEVLQPLVRRVIWVALGRAPAAILSYSEGSRLQVPAPLTRLSAPLIARAEQHINDASDLNVRADLAHLGNHLARVDRWIEHEVVGCERPNAADLQIGAGLALLLTIEDVASVVGSRPASQLAFKWFPRYPGRVPGGVLPAAWLR
ncbi:MAG: glutathione S-transferase N-terminal domain-containing protein [Solirubrobacteraceae bacterium]